ncbi:MAG: hypothetical protein ACFFDT_21485 [Candidatus Hodarchaeota archaeon]
MKDIRRGNEKEAMFWAINLERIDYIMLWNALEASTSEDVGLANPMITVIIRSLKEQYYDAAGYSGGSKRDSYRLFLANAILQLCRSKKSRLVDDFVWTVYWDYYNNIEYPIPDYAKTPHTKCEELDDNEFDAWYEQTFMLKNKTDDKFAENLYRKQAKSNKRKHPELPKKYPLKGIRRKVKTVDGDASTSKNPRIKK